MTDLVYFTDMINGNLVEAVIHVYKDLIGDWWWVWIFGLSFLMLYNKSRDYASVGIIGLTVLVHIFPVMPPSIHLILYIFLAISIANILYKVYH